FRRTEKYSGHCARTWQIRGRNQAASVSGDREFARPSGWWSMSKQPLIDQLDIAIGRIIADPEVQLEPLASMDAAVLDLLDVARDLRELPNPDFRARLRADLERNISMSTKMVTKTVEFREGFRTLTPYLLPPNEGYLDFLKNVFGAVQTERTDMGP